MDHPLAAVNLAGTGLVVCDVDHADVGALKGDRLIVRYTPSAVPGQLVVTNLDRGVTLQRYEHGQPIVGVVIGLVRVLSSNASENGDNA